MPQDGLIQHQEIGAALAERIVAAARAAVADAGFSAAIIVCDRSGEVVAALRMDGTARGAYRLAADKAHTAILWEVPSGYFMQTTQPGGEDWGFQTTSGGRIVVYAGGLPIHVDGGLVGAIGVSGGTAQQDEAAAQAALDGCGLSG